MLTDLRVADLGVIDELEIELGPGLTVLTGETGAGKTFLVGALLLALGAKADGGLVRHGASEAVVEARFEGSDGEVVVRRVLPAGGRSKAYLNGSLASVAELEALAVANVELHGQHGQLRLTNPTVVRGLLDRLGGIDRRPYLEARDALARLEAEGAEAAEAMTERELDLLAFEVAEIEAAGPLLADEDVRLRAEEELLGSVEALHEALDQVRAALSADDGAQAMLGDAMGALRGLEAAAELGRQLGDAQAQLAEAAAAARILREQVDHDPQRLVAVQERRRVLADLSRKYGPSVDDIAAYLASAKVKLARAAEAEGWRVRHEAAVAAARAGLDEAARQLRQARAGAAKELAGAVTDKIRRLAIGGGQVAVELGDDPAAEAPVLLYSSAPDLPLRDLGAVASGGELSRIMLAIAITTGAEADTVVFDEIDAGVGGQAALAIAEALSSLAERRQVLVVTHLAQVAAVADQQVVLARPAGASTTATKVSGEDRVEELARMLSGSPASATARAHAQELLAASGQA